MKQAATGLLALIILVPTALAGEDAAGVLFAEGGTTLPSGTALEAYPLALMTRGPTIGTLDAPWAKVHYMDRHYTAVTNPVHDVQHSNSGGDTHMEIRDGARMLIENFTTGFIGVYTAEGARARFHSVSPTDLLPREESAIRSGMAAKRGEEPHSSGYIYQKTVQGPHLYAKPNGTLTISGPFALKILGPDVQAWNDSWSRGFPTGFGSKERLAAPEARIVESDLRWMLVEAPEGASVTFEDPAVWELATWQTRAAWSGALTLSVVDGALETWRSEYVPSGRSETIEGSFSGDLTAAQRQEELVMRIQLQGSLIETSMERHSIPLETGVIRSPVVLGLLGAVGLVLAAAGFAAGTALRRRPRAPPPPALLAAPFAAEDCVARANEAMGLRRWQDAEAWLERAHRLLPTCAAVCVDLAVARRELGNHDEALALLEDARRLPGGDGEVEYVGAMTALRAGRPLDEVEAWLARALEADPACVLAALEEDAFACLEGRPRFEAAVGAALLAYHARGDAGS